MGEDSRLLISESVLDDPPFYMATSLDLIMLAMGGKERSLESWEQLVSAAGLKISSVSRTDGAWRATCVLECVKA